MSRIEQMIKAAGFLLTIVALQAEADGALAAEGERFRPTAAGIVAEPASGLEWTAADNGYDLDWTAAQRFCADLRLDGRKGWRLPTAAELLGLVDHSGRDKTDCSVNGAQFTCSISPTFRLSSVVQWSADPAPPIDGDPQAWNVHFGGEGFKMFDSTSDTGHFRALCVRQP